MRKRGRSLVRGIGRMQMIGTAVVKTIMTVCSALIVTKKMISDCVWRIFKKGTSCWETGVDSKKEQAAGENEVKIKKGTSCWEKKKWDMEDGL